MMHMMRLPRLHLSALVVGGVLGVGALGGTAEAGHAHFSGGVRFSGRVTGSGGRVGVRFARPFWRPRVWVGGSVWVGGDYYPRPYYYYYYPEYVPSYYSGYGGSYSRVQPNMATAAPGVVAVATAKPPMPTFGIGVAAGGSNVDGRQESSDLSAPVRFPLTPGPPLQG